MIAPAMGEGGMASSHSGSEVIFKVKIRISGMTKRVIPRKGGDALWQNKAKRKCCA